MITTGSVRGWCSVPQRGHDAHEPGLAHLRQRAAGRAEAVPAVPVEERGGVGHDPALLLGEDHDGVAQPDRPRALGGLRRARGRAAEGAGRQRRRRLGAGRRHVLVDGEERPVLVEAEEQRLGGRGRLGERDDREPVAGQAHAAAARHDRARRRVGAARGHPGGVAPAPVARRGRGARRRTRSRQGRDDLGGEQLERVGVPVQEVLEHHALHAGVRVLGEPLGDLRRAAGGPAVVGREAGRRRGAPPGRAPRRRPPRPRSRA